MSISTHVLDISRGVPAVGVSVTLEAIDESGAGTRIGAGVTDGDGRVRQLVANDVILLAGSYRLTFDTGSYFAAQNLECFHPRVVVLFKTMDANRHYHVPLLV